MVFTMFHLMFHNHSSTGDLHRARTKVPHVSYTGDNFASMSSLLNKCFCMEMPNSRGCDEFSELLQTVLFTMGDTGLNAVYNANADIWHVPRELDVMVREWESLNAKAELARMHRDRHCHETVVWYVHHLPESMKIPRWKQAVPRWKRVTEGRRPQDRSLKGSSLVSPGLGPQRDRFLTAKQGRLLHQRHCSWVPRCRGVGTLVGRPADYLPWGTVGQWLPAPCNGGP